MKTNKRIVTRRDLGMRMALWADKNKGVFAGKSLKDCAKVLELTFPGEFCSMATVQAALDSAGVVVKKYATSSTKIDRVRVLAKIVSAVFERLDDQLLTEEERQTLTKLIAGQTVGEQ
jgi:hypothetical protein